MSIKELLAPTKFGATTPPLDPAAIMMVLGEADRVTPYAGGNALAQTWGLPEGNIFRRPRGHFSQAVAMPGEHEVLAALARRLHAGV